jgi:hypothetical protein
MSIETNCQESGNATNLQCRHQALLSTARFEGCIFCFVEDILRVFGGQNQLRSSEIISRLSAAGAWPRAGISMQRGSDFQKLASVLAPLLIRSKLIRFENGKNGWGYRRDWFEDALRKSMPALCGRHE